MKKFTILALLTLFLQITVSSQPNFDECTIGVAHGSATQDERPLVWKTRDWESNDDMRVLYRTDYNYKFISVYKKLWPNYPVMGVNEHGLALVKSATNDLTAATTGATPTEIMNHALGYCKTIDEFQAFLDSTNITGRQATGNYGMIDSTGAAVIFEAGGYEYWKFDAQNATDGYIIRTNFTINGGGSTGIQRYNRSSTLINNFHSGDSLNHKSLLRYQMRDFSDFSSLPIPIPYPHQVPGKPYGYFYTGNSICNHLSNSAAVIQGILPDEKPELSTMWAMLGHPACAISAPYWPIGETPNVAHGTYTAPLCNIAKDIRELLFDDPDNPLYINSYRMRDSVGGGLWTCTFPTEDLILQSAETNLNAWRNLDSIPVDEMLEAENYLAEMAYESLESCYENLTVGVEVLAVNNEFLIYPNPASNSFSLVLPHGIEGILIQIINIQGTIIMHQEVSNDNLSFNVSTFPKGLYIIRLYTNKSVGIKKLIIQ